MNIFLACFLGCLMALTLRSVALSTFLRVLSWYGARRMARELVARGLYPPPGAAPAIGPAFTMPASMIGEIRLKKTVLAYCAEPSDVNLALVREQCASYVKTCGSDIVAENLTRLDHALSNFERAQARASEAHAPTPDLGSGPGQGED